MNCWFFVWNVIKIQSTTYLKKYWSFAIYTKKYYSSLILFQIFKISRQNDLSCYFSKIWIFAPKWIYVIAMSFIETFLGRFSTTVAFLFSRLGYVMDNWHICKVNEDQESQFQNQPPPDNSPFLLSYKKQKRRMESYNSSSSITSSPCLNYNSLHSMENLAQGFDFGHQDFAVTSSTNNTFSTLTAITVPEVIFLPTCK